MSKLEPITENNANQFPFLYLRYYYLLSVGFSKAIYVRFSYAYF